MKLDRTLVSELRRTVPAPDNREATRAFRRRIREAAQGMSNSDIMHDFNHHLAANGRAVTAIIVAATLIERAERLDNWGLQWANEVIALWPHTQNALYDALIRDEDLHPTHICGYAREFIELTTEA